MDKRSQARRRQYISDAALHTYERIQGERLSSIDVLQYTLSITSQQVRNTALNLSVR